MTRSWNDNPAGLYVNVPVLGQDVDLGSPSNPLNNVYARNIVAAGIAGDTTLAFNNFLEAVDSSGSGSLDLLKGDATDNTVLNALVGKLIKFQVNEADILTLSATNLSPAAAGVPSLGTALLPYGTVVARNFTISTVANGKAGTVTLNGATPVSVANTSITAGSTVIFTLKTVGGTVGAYPAIQTITPGVGFDVAGTALDTSVYNYAIVETV